MHAFFRGIPLAAALAVAVVSGAFAGSATLSLKRASLTNVSDAAGLYQQEGGSILSSGGATIGYYATTRRVTTGGTTALNTAATTVTLFFAARGAPNNITLQGAHDYSSGAFAGSVSGASTKYSWLRDADASYTIPSSGLTTVVLSWTGAAQLLVP